GMIRGRQGHHGVPAPSTRDKTMKRSSDPVTEIGDDRLADDRSDLPRLGDEDRRRRGGQGTGSPGSAVITKTKEETNLPRMYGVLLLNDDCTPMEFVVHVLERFFNKDSEAATKIMLHVHQHGIGECGVFTYEVAETKVTQVMEFEHKYQHPLQCV